METIPSQDCSVYTIYVIQNIENDHVYVGQTSVRPCNRWKQHRKQLRGNRHGNIHLQRSWNIHGESAFVFFKLDECSTQADVNDLEETYRLWYYAIGISYNIRAGGRSGCLSEESRIKLRLANLGKKHSDETKEKCRLAALKRGKVRLTQEQKDHLSRINTGKKHSDATINKMRMLKPSALSIEKTRLANLGKKWCPEIVAKRAAGIKKAYWNKRSHIGQQSFDFDS